MSLEKRYQRLIKGTKMKHALTLIISIILLSACAAPKQLASKPIEITQEQLPDYWIVKASTTVLNFNHKIGAASRLNPSIPTASGEVTLRFLIDSTGKTYSPEIVSSKPRGMWDKIAKKNVENFEFFAAKTNPDNTPVYVTQTIKYDDPASEKSQHEVYKYGERLSGRQ